MDGSSGEMRVDVDHYLILGVPRTADPAVIRAAYRPLSEHPQSRIGAGDGRTGVTRTVG